MITVKDAQSNRHDLQGRLEAMVMLVIENAGEIAKSPNAQIVFDCAGGKVTASPVDGLKLFRPGNWPQR